MHHRRANRGEERFNLGNRRSIRLSYGTDLILLTNFSERLDFAPILLRFARLSRHLCTERRGPVQANVNRPTRPFDELRRALALPLSFRLRAFLRWAEAFPFALRLPFAASCF